MDLADLHEHASAVFAALIAVVAIACTLFVLANPDHGGVAPPRNCDHTPTYEKAAACAGADLSQRRDTPGR